MRRFFSVLLFVLMVQQGGLQSKESGEMAKKPVLVFETTQGTIECELMPSVAPKAVENITELAGKEYYNGVVFHRIIKEFMIQGGDPTGTGAGGESKWGHPFEDEVSEDVTFDRPGLLAMANAGPSTNGSQFFITTAETPWLHKRHTIFGAVVKGYDVVEKLEAVETDGRDRPVEEQKILKAYVR